MEYAILTAVLGAAALFLLWFGNYTAARYGGLSVVPKPVEERTYRESEPDYHEAVEYSDMCSAVTCYSVVVPRLHARLHR